jgi:hypothetical protein
MRRRFSIDQRHGSADHQPAMPKKSGPKHIDPETFAPVVWRNKGVPIGTDLEFLVCKRRVYHGNPVIGASKAEGRAADCFIHPMAIQLTPKFEIMTRLKLIAGTWDRDSPVKHGISDRCAKVALAQAYHGINASVDLVTMEPEFEPKFKDLYFHKNGVRIRNIATALRWTRWERDGSALKDRQAELERVLQFCPEFCTELQIKRFAAEQGL